MSGVQIGRVVSSFSFFVLAVFAFCGEYSDLNARLQAAHTTAEKEKIIAASDISDPELKRYQELIGKHSADASESAEKYVSLQSLAESAPDASDQSGRIKQIKSSSFFTDEGKKDHANWLSGALERLKNLAPNRKNENEVDSPGLPSSGMAGLGGFLIYFVWFLLGAAIIAFIIYAVRFVNFGKLRKRKAKAMLDDDEPERTLDEWITLADEHERNGNYREAVRSLYLACLLKFDERNVARFVRSQTNWEHLSRIETSPRKPANLDFRSPTQAFDQVWYGHKVRGSADVRDFKAWYSEVSRTLQEAAA